MRTMSLFWKESDERDLPSLGVVMRGVMLLVFLLGGWLPSSWANQVWEFVDGEGVTHIGNVPPSAAARGVIWLSRVPPASVVKGNDRSPSALQFPGYDDVKQHLEAAAVAQSLRQQSFATALRQYQQLLAGPAQVQGVELDAATTPLVQ